jgi:hypothetical protein
MKTLLKLLLVWVITVPVALVGTFLLAPFWGWFEAQTGVEALGHSGPAEWCYLAVYAVLALLGSLLGVRRRTTAPTSP